MSRSFVLGNGNILICVDECAQVRDVYFPYVGLENHIGGRFKHRLGVWADGKMRWFENSWNVTVQSEDDAPVGSTVARSDELNLAVFFSDVVYNEKNIFLRKAMIRNTGSERRDVKLYFGQEFEIYESHRGDTAYFDPMHHTLIHYNGKRVFLINGRIDNRSFDDYTTGVFNIEGKEGSYKNAEKGTLPQNPIEHGPTDSVMGFYTTLAPKEEKIVYYWMAIGKSIKEVQELDAYVQDRTPEYMMHTTRDFWRAWVTRHRYDFSQLGKSVESLFKKSLFILRAHTDNHGAILASGDSEMLQFGKDSYGYSWPRDGALSAFALDLAGNTNITRRYFQFCDKTISDGGYFMHKYRPDESLGSSWHPWIKDGKITLPIQEDETALIVYALWNHYELSKDIEFVEDLYNSLIKPAAEFMVSFRDETTALPKASYDPWEEKMGIFTYTTATVIAGLLAASNFARILGKADSSRRYAQAADEMRSAITTHLWNEAGGYFYKALHVDGGSIAHEDTIDMSAFYGLVAFATFDVNDERITRFAETVQKELLCETKISGFARYKGDRYFRQKGSEDVPGNPWVITALWMAQYHIAKAKDSNGLQEARKWIEWTVARALPSGILAEQFDPHTGEHLSAMPLTWSHAEFVTTVIKYLDKLEVLGLCDNCNPVNRE